MSNARQLRNALLIIGGVIFAILSLWAGRFLPGTLGEVMSRVFHIITTPIILEASFGILGIVIVMTLAHYNEKRADEWVEMDFPDEKNDR
jgi:predicted membrane chloride channel (bestrophin family)